jgi:NADH-quinone oxidoreductase subunit E
MAFLIGQMWAPLLLVLVIAAAMGWMWHAIRSSARLRDMEAERETLRRELVEFVEPADRSAHAEEYARAIEVMRARESVAEARWAELERQLAEVKAQRDDYAGRAAELERALERMREAPAPQPVAHDENLARIAALESEVMQLNAALAEPKEDARVRPLAWRARYFEARTRYLEGEARAAAPTPGAAALAALEAERDAARMEAREWRARAEAPRESDELTALKWRARYLEARTRYLENQLRESAPAVDEEAARRAHWRKRYLETRNAHLEARLRARLAAPQEDSVSRRLQWRARYLDARVQHLEAKLATPEEAAAPLAAAAPVEPAEPEPLVPHGAEVRPVALPAPRQGAPDDLTLIVGVDPKTEVTLHALGVYHFDQIAAWTPANIAWVDQYLRFRGRIVRERWVEQAEDLARGERAAAHRRRYLEVEPA